MVFEMSGEPRKSSSTKWPLRLIVIFAVGVLLGFGLCAGGGSVSDAGLVMIAFSALGLVLSMLTFLWMWLTKPSSDE